MRNEAEYPFRESVRKASTVFSILVGVLVVGLPLMVYLLYKRSKAKVIVDDNGLTVFGFSPGADRWEFAEIERIGLLTVRIVAGGLGGALARAMNGGDDAINLVARTRRGKTLKFVLSRYDKHEEILTRAVTGTRLTPETLSIGLWGPKWPERPGAGR